MTGRKHVALVGAAATLLAALPLSTIFLQWTWLVQAVIVVIFVSGAAMLARSLRAPTWAQALAMGAGLLVSLTFLTPDSKAILGLIPTFDTFSRFNQLLNEAGAAMREMGVPVDDHDGLLFLTALGVGGVAICVDLCAVSLRRPALAGLPMLAIYSVPVAVHQDSTSIIPFMAGAAGFLWLLVIDNVDKVRRFGRRFTGDGRDIDAWEPSPLAAAGRRMAVVGVLLAVALPFLVPGMTTGLLDRFGTGGDGSGNGTGSGRGRQVNLWALLEGTLKQDEEVDMVRVTTNDPSPGYLRFGVSDELSVEGFRNRSPGGRTVATAALTDPRRSNRSGVDYYGGKATVDIVNLDMSLLPVYSDPTALTRGIDGRWFYDPRMQLIYSTSTTTAGKKYEFEFARPEYNPAALRRVQPLPQTNDIRRFNTAVPAGVVEVEELVAERIKGKTNEYDKVRALYDYFSSTNGFEYSLQTTSETGGTAITEFLTNKKGYCVQYAAALAWMVREADIPARVAFGFTRGTRGDDNTYTLTNRNLHAWTEVYFDGFGWLPFDATPSTWITGAVDPIWAPNPEAPQLSPTGPGPSAGPESTLNPEGDASRTGDNSAEDGEIDSGAGSIGSTQNRWPLYLAIAGAVLLFLFAMPAARRALLRRRRRSSGVPATGLAVSSTQPAPGEAYVLAAGGPEAAKARHDAHAAWDELIDTMVDYQLPVDLAETPRTTAERVIRESYLRGDAEQGIRLLGRAEERARYARDPLVTGEFGVALRAVRRAIAERVSRGTRLSAIFLPRSVLLRWRNAAVSGSTTIVATTGRWRDTIFRAISPRRLLMSRGR